MSSGVIEAIEPKETIEEQLIPRKESSLIDSKTGEPRLTQTEVYTLIKKADELITYEPVVASNNKCKHVIYNRDDTGYVRYFRSDRIIDIRIHNPDHGTSNVPSLKKQKSLAPREQLNPLFGMFQEKAIMNRVENDLKPSDGLESLMTSKSKNYQSGTSSSINVNGTILYKLVKSESPLLRYKKLPGKKNFKRILFNGHDTGYVRCFKVFGVVDIRKFNPDEQLD